MNPISLLFQSGYLTIKEVFSNRSRLMFRLEVPNLEVKIALNDVFIDGFTGKNPSEKISFQNNLFTCLENGNIQGMTDVIKRLFASIPYRNFTKSRLPDFEGYYASVLYAFFSSLDAQIIPEDITNHGQVDMTVKLGKHIYVMEIKLVDDKDLDNSDDLKKPDQNIALDQIKAKNYAQKYLNEPDKTVHQVGLVFSKSQRNLIKWDSK